MQTSIVTLLKEPFPENTSFGQSLIGMFWVSLFIALFLYFFKPFGLYQVEQNLLGLCMAFGGVTLLVSMVYGLVFRYGLRINTDLPSWTLWKWFAQSIALVCLIAIGNFLLLLWLYPDEVDNWNDIVGIISNTLILGSIPIAFSGVLIQLRAAKRNRAQAEGIGRSPLAQDEVRLARFEISKNEFLEVDISAILYVEAMQNYVVVHYFDKDELKNQIVRSTIGSIASQLNESSVLRCHRSYLVNTRFVGEVSGNAQGLKLVLPKAKNVEISVSRTYIPAFKQAMS